MNDKHPSSADRDQPKIYEFRIQGHLDGGWADRFGDLRMTLEDDGSTRLTGPVIDQPALFGLLRKVRDCGMPLLSVVCTDVEEADASQSK